MIPINDLQRIDTDLLHKIKTAVNNCFSKGWYLLGPETESFEQEFASYCGTNHCVTVANGTDGLEISLRALGVKAGDNVATVANAGMYSTIAISNIGANPIYIEIDAHELNMDPLSLQQQLSNDLKAIIVTHLYGKVANIEEIIRLAKKAEIPVIEDCAQAHGASLNGKKVGSFGDLGCFSFYPTKNLGAMGDAGAIVTNNAQIFSNVRKLRQYGWERKYYSTIPGGKNSRIDEIQAAVLRVKLHYLDEWNNCRREIAKKYTERFKGLDLLLPQTLDETYVGHLYVIRTKKRDNLRSFLLEKNIHTEIHYPIPDYLQKSAPTNSKITLPLTEKSCNEVLSLPCFPELTEDEIQSVIDNVQKFFNAH